MLYNTDKARKSHIERISQLIDELTSTPLANVSGGRETISDTVKYLCDYKELIQKGLTSESST